MAETITHIPLMMSVQEASEYLGLAASTLNKRRLTGDGPQYLKLGRRVVYRKTDLDLWLESHRRFSTSVAA